MYLAHSLKAAKHCWKRGLMNNDDTVFQELLHCIVKISIPLKLTCRFHVLWNETSATCVYNTLCENCQSNSGVYIIILRKWWYGLGCVFSKFMLKFKPWCDSIGVGWSQRHGPFTVGSVCPYNEKERQATRLYMNTWNAGYLLPQVRALISHEPCYTLNLRFVSLYSQRK